MIACKNVQSGYGQTPILFVDNLSLKKGEVVSVLGKNGCGKSTLLKTLVGRLHYEGFIELDGVQLNQLSSMERARHMSYLPQQINRPDMDVYTLVCHGRFPYLGMNKILSQQDQDIVETCLKQVELWERKDKNIQQLSGGQQQRAWLAMALAQNTDYVLLDEPNASMDIDHQLSTMQLFQSLARQGKGIVLTSHDIVMSFSYSDRICLIDQGKSVGIKTPDQWLETPEIIHQVLGVWLQKNDTDTALYPYILSKEK